MVRPGNGGMSAPGALPLICCIRCRQGIVRSYKGECSMSEVRERLRHSEQFRRSESSSLTICYFFYNDASVNPKEHTNSVKDLE